MKIIRIVSLIVLFTAFVFAGRSAGHSLRSKSTVRTDALATRSPELGQATKSRSNSRSTDKLAGEEQPVPSQTVPTQEPVLEESGYASVPPTETPDQQMAPQPLRQNNILLIGVDDLQAAKPKLEGAWLVLYLTQNPHFTLMPIFPGIPAEDGKATKSDGHLAKLFQADPAGVPGPGFFSALKDRGLWWSGYFIVDRLAMGEILDTIGETTREGEPSESGSQSMKGIPPAWQDPSGALTGQTQVAQAFCHEAAKLDADDIGAIDHLFLLFPDHVLSDIPREQAAAELVGMLVNSSGITCEFPTLATRPK